MSCRAGARHCPDGSVGIRPVRLRSEAGQAFSAFRGPPPSKEAFLREEKNEFLERQCFARSPKRWWETAPPAGRAMRAGNRTPGLRLRIVMRPDVAIGPGKADLLEGIKDTGSIAAAGRRMGMSYKRAWLLVESMNRCFREPLVATSRGGRARGGATLTACGERVLGSYRRMQALSEEAVAPELAELRHLLVDNSGR